MSLITDRVASPCLLGTIISSPASIKLPRLRQASPSTQHNKQSSTLKHLRVLPRLKLQLELPRESLSGGIDTSAILQTYGSSQAVALTTALSLTWSLGLHKMCLDCQMMTWRTRPSHTFKRHGLPSPAIPQKGSQRHWAGLSTKIRLVRIWEDLDVG